MFIKVRKLLVARFMFILFLLGGMLSPAQHQVALAASPAETVRASVDSTGGQAEGYSFSPSISADGRYITFESTAADLVAGDTNNVYDVFLRDMQTGTTTRVSVDSSGTQGNEISENPSISGDGRYVAFESDATNLVPGDTNGWRDIFVHDTQTGQTTRVSVGAGGGQPDGPSFFPSISADGRLIAFQSLATNLVPGGNGVYDIYVYDRQTGTTTRVSVGPNGVPADLASDAPFVSADGRYVSFFSYATNLVPGDTNDNPDVFVHDLQTGVTTRVSVASDGTQADRGSEESALSADGRYVVFDSDATNLVPGDTNERTDVFLHDRQTGTTTLISVNSNELPGNESSRRPAISGDGRYVAFESGATNLVALDTNAASDIFVRDLQSGTTTRISVNSNGEQADRFSAGPVAISADGQNIAFRSDATNLVTGDTNQNTDVFLHRQGSLPPSLDIVYLSLANGQTVGGVASADEDILRFDGTSWRLFFDGSDVGVGSSDLVAFSILDAHTILMSFSTNVTVNGVSAAPQDILRFDATSLGSNTAGTFSLYFDGSDVGLTTSSEKIDALLQLPDGRLLISTTGTPSVPGVSGMKDEDVLVFFVASLGDVTAGAWSLYFDGSDVGLDAEGEDVDALDVVNGDIYLSTLGNFSVSGVSGADEDVFVCAAAQVGDPTVCRYSSSLYFDGSNWGLSGNDIDAFDRG